MSDPNVPQGQEPGAAPPPPPAPWPGTFRPAPEGAPPPTSEEKQLAMVTHLLSIVTGVIGPLVLWLVKRQESAYIDHHGKEAVNFQITVLLAFVASGVVMCVPFVGLVGVPLSLAIGVGNIVFSILAGVKANEGVRYVYPVSIRLVR